jgi:thiol-disulfide isomerase/thioredoxin
MRPAVAAFAVFSVSVAACAKEPAASQPEPTPPAAKSIDESAPHHVDDGSELVGTPAKPWHLTDWVGSEPLTLEALRGRVVVVRFWTLGCPFCERTMPAIALLADEFADQPVTFVGAFHAKPVSSVPDMREPAALAKKWNVAFPLAFDRGWRTLNAWYMDGYHRHATSVTFVIDKRGVIAHVHKGPVFHPSDDPDEADENRDFLAVRQAIRDALDH